jgi:magnesium chelatase family protein
MSSAFASPPATICGKPLGLASVHASALVGLTATPVSVEVCCTRGPAFFQLVGLAEAAVREARVRVASALGRLGVLLDEYAVTVNLAPADQKKGGAALDLAIAVGILVAIGEAPSEGVASTLFLGELSLDGYLRPVRGVLPQLKGALAVGLARAVVPEGNALEAGSAQGLDVRVAGALDQVLEHARGRRALGRAVATPYEPRLASGFGDLADVRGQATAKRALEVCAAGAHNLLMIGPPGGGKTLLARLLPSILPPLSYTEAIETTEIHSVAGLLDPDEGVVRTRPFRAPHHSVSAAGLVGGGELPRPGEVSLAHHGVLFLDELAEFQRSALEALRQPLEDGRISIVRARARAWFPARPIFVAAVNPCPCGYWGHPRRRCVCNTPARRRYLSRLSGPLLDRIDLHVAVAPVEVRTLCGESRAEPSERVRARVAEARRIQLSRRTAGLVNAAQNATLELAELERVTRLDKNAKQLVAQAVERLGLSARAYARVLRVARTIADLDGADRVAASHIAEAVQARLLDRQPLR